MRRMSTASGRWLLVGITLVAMIAASVILMHPGLIRASYEEDPEPEPTPGTTPATTPGITPGPTLAPTPCPPNLPGETVDVTFLWIDEGSISVPIPLIGTIEIPMNYEMAGSAKFEINNTCPSITIPDGISTDAPNIPTVSLPVLATVSIEAELNARLIGQQVSSSSCGDGGSMSKYSATAVANTKLTISVSFLWGRDVWERNYPFGEEIPVEVTTKCVYCSECD